MKKGTIFYLRTDIFCGNEKLLAGGSVAHTMGVIEGLLAHNYEVIVASSVMIEQLQRLSLKKLYRLALPKIVLYARWKLSCFFSTFFFLKQSLPLLKRNSVTYIYQRYLLLNATGVLLSWLKKIPLILEYNGSEVWIDRFWSRKKWFSFSWLMRFIEWLNLAYAHQIVVVSKPLKDELIMRGFDAKKIVVNPNGVNTTALNPALLCHEREVIRMQLNITEKFVFGFIGTFSTWHGIEMLVAIIPQIIKQQPRSHFLLIGDGPLYSYAHDALHEWVTARHVTFTGLIVQHEAKKYLAACDAFLSPTQPNQDGTPFFGSPTKIFEYLSMAKPIIASELDQVAEIVTPAFKLHDIQRPLMVANQVGIVLPPTHEQGFIQAACQLMNLDSYALERMGHNARTKAINHHDWYHHVETIMHNVIESA